MYLNLNGHSPLSRGMNAEHELTDRISSKRASDSPHIKTAKIPAITFKVILLPSCINKSFSTRSRLNLEH